MSSAVAYDRRLKALLSRSRNIARWIRDQLASPTGKETEPHFVREYQHLVTKALALYPTDKAMSLVVGGNFDRAGDAQRALLRWIGLRDGMRLLDFGCGSGRLASALAREAMRIDYYGIEVDQRLLDFAKSKASGHFRFATSHALTIPAPDASADMVCAFSVFTHLRQSETYLYLEDIRRVLRPGGKLVFSFLEFAQPLYWKIFEETLSKERRNMLPHLNEFIERNAIQV